LLALAVVGPIASGKSVVLRTLAELGAATCAADDLGRELTQVGQPALARIFAEFGEQYRGADGSLDRQALARLIFSDDGARARLEDLLHPLILERIRAWLDQRRSGDAPPPVAAVEVLHLPAKRQARTPFDVVWLCTAPEAVRRERLMTRDGLAPEEARQRLAAQKALNIEDCRPDLVLDASGSREQLRAGVVAAWRELLSAAGPGGDA